MKSYMPFGKILPMLNGIDQETYKNNLADQYVRKQFSFNQSDINANKRSITHYVSRREVDRDREVVVPSGADMSEYAHNPIVLYMHNRAELPIARSDNMTIDEYGIKSTTVFAEHEYADVIWKLVKDGFLSGASLGFLPRKAVTKKSPEWASVTKDLGNQWGISNWSGVDRIYTDYVILEYSIVTIPSNSLATMDMKALGISDDMIKRLRLDIDYIQKPYPNEHACRIKNPDGFQQDSFRRMERDHNGKKYAVIMAKPNGSDTMEDQAFRYNKDDWSAEEARTHCAMHNGTFEGANGKCVISIPREVKPVNIRREINKVSIVEAARTIKEVRVVRPVFEPIDIEHIADEVVKTLRGQV